MSNSWLVCWISHWIVFIQLWKLTWLYVPLIYLFYTHYAFLSYFVYFYGARGWTQGLAHHTPNYILIVDAPFVLWYWKYSPVEQVKNEGTYKLSRKNFQYIVASSKGLGPSGQPQERIASTQDSQLGSKWPQLQSITL